MPTCEIRVLILETSLCSQIAHLAIDQRKKATGDKVGKRIEPGRILCARCQECMEQGGQSAMGYRKKGHADVSIVALQITATCSLHLLFRLLPADTRGHDVVLLCQGERQFVLMIAHQSLVWYNNQRRLDTGIET